jgi:hypothetical protein
MSALRRAVEVVVDVCLGLEDAVDAPGTRTVFTETVCLTGSGSRLGVAGDDASEVE